MAITSRSSTLAIGFCFPIIGAILCTARTVLRRKNGSRLGLDDFFAVLAWVLVTGACACLIVGVYIGAFFLNNATDPALLTYQEHLEAQVSGAFYLLYNSASASVKLSLLFFFRRIFVGRIFNIVSWTFIGLTLVYALWGLIAPILFCGWHIYDNFEGPWDNCPKWGFEIQFVTYILDNIIDFGIIIMPIPMLLKLHIDVIKKLLLVVIFLFGGLAVVASVINTTYQFITMVDLTAIIGTPGSPTIGPASNKQLLLLNWPAIEIGVGLITCNLPSLAGVATSILSKYRYNGRSLFTRSRRGPSNSQIAGRGADHRSKSSVAGPLLNASLPEVSQTGNKLTLVELIRSTPDAPYPSSSATTLGTRDLHATSSADNV